MFEVGEKVRFYVQKWGKWLEGVVESENESLTKDIGKRVIDIRQTKPIVLFHQTFNNHLFAVEEISVRTLDGKGIKLTPKQKMIRRIENLPWGDILFGYDKQGRLININEYDDEKDVFCGYDGDMKPLELKFENLPRRLKHV